MAVEARAEGDGSATIPTIVPARPRRSRRRLLILMGLLAAFVIAAVAFISNYMPLSPANGTSGGGGRYLGSFESPSGEPFSVQEYTYRRGGRVWFGFGLHNDGPFGVTIQGIDSRLPSTREFSGLAHQSGVWIAKSRGWTGPPRDSKSEPLRPFWLGPGQERWVVIEIQFRDCPPVGEGITLTHHLLGAYISYRVLGLPRNGFMPYDQVIHLTGPTPDPACT